MVYGKILQKHHSLLVWFKKNAVIVKIILYFIKYTLVCDGSGNLKIKVLHVMMVKLALA